MTARYEELFRIECRHGYFADGQCRLLTLSPTMRCRRMLDRDDCLFRPAVGGGAIYRRMPAVPFEDAAPLAFALVAQSTALVECTEMDGAQGGIPDGSIHYFNNLADHRATLDGVDRQLLHPPGQPFAQGPLPVYPPRFDYPCAVPMGLFDPLGNQIDRLQPSAGFCSLDVPEGRYQLRGDDGARHDFYCSVTSPASLWGIVEIFPGAPALFTVALEPRKSIWRYVVVSQSTVDRAYDDFRVVGSSSNNGDGGTIPTFAAPVRQRIRGKDAWIFDSTAPITLREYPADRYAFALKREEAAGGFALPYAQANRTRLARGPDGDVRAYSEIYVYL